MTFEHQISQWLLPILGTLLLVAVTFIGRQFLTRMDKHDDALNDIKDLLTSEVGLLRSALHDLDKRVLWIESTCYDLHGRAPFGNNNPKT